MYTKEEISKAMELRPSLWVQKHRIKNEAGIPIEFTSHKFLRDIYDDMSRVQVVLKPPQVGMTVLQIIKTLYCAKKKGWDIIYTLPTAADVNDMAGGKINRIIAQNPVLSEWVKDHDTVEQKAVGIHTIYYRSTFVAKAAMMVSSDLNVHDEVDASDASVIVQYETRLEAKADGRRWYFSHPSLAGHGVDIQWAQSDKKEWFITCPICTKEQVMKWPDNFDIEQERYICTACNGTLSDETRSNGVWRPTVESPISGYHISQMMCDWISAPNIIAKKNDAQKDEQYFYNMVLGLPHLSSENKIETTTVLKNVVPQVNTQSPRVVIGVDTGLPGYFTCMNKEGIFHHGQLKDPSQGDPYLELEKFLQRWPNSIIVSDQGGDLTPMRLMQMKYPGRVFLCFYRKDRKTKDTITWGKHNEYDIVTVDRNRMIQLIIEQMRDVGRFRLNGTEHEWKEWASHFANIYRVSKETPYGVEYVWERSGPDHYVHSLLYALVGMDKYQEVQAKIVGNDSFAGLPIGRFEDQYTGFGVLKHE